MRICAALVESAFAWRRATGERETCWCKRGAVAGERDDWRYRVIGLLLACGQTVWRNYVRDVAVAMRICAALVESAFAWRRATGERETCWCKPGVSLVSGMIGGIL